VTEGELVCLVGGGIIFGLLFASLPAETQKLLISTVKSAVESSKKDDENAQKS